MFNHLKCDLKGIRKIICKNASGEIIFTHDMQTDLKIPNVSSSNHKDSDTSQTKELFDLKMQDSVKSKFEYPHYLIVKTEGHHEDVHTFVRVSDIQSDRGKCNASSSKTSKSSKSETADTARPDLEDVLCYQIQPGNELFFF